MTALYKNLVPFDLLTDHAPVTIDLAYADANHPRNIFDIPLYHDAARCWAHKDMAAVTLLAARLLQRRHDWTLEIKDCLRTTDAQAAMQDTDIVKANPHWMIEPRLLAPPGKGAHPFAMAVDVHPRDAKGELVNMGTEFDEMTPESARDHQDFAPQVLRNRLHLEYAFRDAGGALGHSILPLPAEWWDFRFEAGHYATQSPLSDFDLPPQMQIHALRETEIENLPDGHFEGLANEVLALINKADETLSGA